MRPAATPAYCTRASTMPRTACAPRSALKAIWPCRPIAKKNNLPLLRCGKVVVARKESELPALRLLHERATANGARVELVDERQLAEIEPNARTTGTALYSHFTAQVAPKAVLQCLRHELEQSGKVRFLYNARFLSALGHNAMRTTQGRVAFSQLINAAGAFSDRVAHCFGVGLNYRLVPFKGIYKKLRKDYAHMVRGNIYPVPDVRNPFLGIHFTRSVHGEVYLGPTAIPALGRENYGLLQGADREAFSILWRDSVLFFHNSKFRKVAMEEPKKYIFRSFFNDARKLVKKLEPEWVEPTSKAGIRPQLIDLKTHELVMDFVIEKKGPCLHILNSISPAFTSSLAFAQLVTEKYLA